MINASELRLGNLILWNHTLSHPSTTLPKAWVEVTSIEEDRLGYISPRVEQRVEPFEDDLLPLDAPHSSLKEFEPILLTRELVEHCGFVNSDEQDHRTTFKKGPLKVNINKDDSVFVAFDQTELPCQSLHQLQNLYFALTGEELRIMREG